MFRRQNNNNNSSTSSSGQTGAAAIERVTSVLGPGINWRGSLRGAGGVRIEGTFEGDMQIRGMIAVGETGRVWGDVSVISFSTEDGAFLRGQVRMEEKVVIEQQTDTPQGTAPQQQMPPAGQGGTYFQR